MTTIEVLVLKGAMLSSVAITLDVLGTANRLRAAAGLPPAFQVSLAGSGARAARAMAPAIPLSGETWAELIVVPGLGLTSEALIDTGLARRDVIAAGKRIAAATEAGRAIAASCSSVFLLAQAGVLARRRATTTWWLAPVFRRRFPDIRLDTDALIVADGPITTAGAAMAQMDLMLALVARHAGPALTDRCTRYLLLDERRSQAPFMALALLAAADDRVAKAQLWAREHLIDGVSVDALAAAAGLAPRTFARRVERVTGLSPVRFLQRLKVERAVELMETTRLPFEEIARQVGYAEPSTLRRLLRKEGGAGPRELRARIDHRQAA